MWGKTGSSSAVNPQIVLRLEDNKDIVVGNILPCGKGTKWPTGRGSNLFNWRPGVSHLNDDREGSHAVAALSTQGSYCAWRTRKMFQMPAVWDSDNTHPLTR